MTLFLYEILLTFLLFSTHALMPRRACLFFAPPESGSRSAPLPAAGPAVRNQRLFCAVSPSSAMTGRCLNKCPEASNFLDFMSIICTILKKDMFFGKKYI